MPSPRLPYFQENTLSISRSLLDHTAICPYTQEKAAFDIKHMKSNKIIQAVIMLLLLCNPSRLAAQQSEYFPLEKGTTWTYKGTVKWTESVNKIKKSKIIWKMRVEKRIKNGSFEIAVMKGHPSDLCWYEPGKKPSSYLIAWKDNKYYEIPISNDLNKLITDEAYLSTRADFNSLFLVVPLKKDMVFGNDPDIQRDGRMYEWAVDDEQRSKLLHVAGISKKKVFTKYILMYRTNPDHQIMEFVPSVGISSYFYRHYGTVSDVDVRLIVFRKK
jgi:hypothetical protein